MPKFVLAADPQKYFKFVRKKVLVVPVDCWWSTSSIVWTSQREDFDGYRTLPRTLQRLFLRTRTLAELTRSMSRTIWLNQFLQAHTYICIHMYICIYVFIILIILFSYFTIHLKLLENYLIYNILFYLSFPYDILVMSNNANIYNERDTM